LASTLAAPSRLIDQPAQNWKQAGRAVYFVEALPYHTAAHGAKLQRHVLRDWARERA